MALSDYVEKKISDHIHAVGSFTAPGANYLALFKSDPTDAGTGTEVNPVIDDTAYTRESITWNACNATTGVATSSNAQTFDAVVYGTGGAAYTVTHIGIYDDDGTTVITAGSFVTGMKYRIKTAGTTDFTLVGAADSTVGTVFVATGAGSGTGDAYKAGNLLEYAALNASISRSVGKTLVFDAGSISSTFA